MLFSFGNYIHDSLKMNRCVNPLCPHCNPGMYGPVRFIPREFTEEEKKQAEEQLDHIVKEAFKRLGEKNALQKRT